MSWDLSLCSGCHLFIRMGSDPKLPEQKLSCQAQAAFIPFQRVRFSLSVPGPLPPSRSAEASGACSQTEVQRAAWTSVAPLDATHGRVFSLVVAIPHPVPRCGRDWGGMEHLLGFGWAHSEVVSGNPETSQTSPQRPAGPLTADHCSQSPLGSTAGEKPVWFLCVCVAGEIEVWYSGCSQKHVLFLGTALKSAKNGCCRPTWTLPPLCPKVESFPWSWLPQIHYCIVARSEQGLTVHLAWAGAWRDVVVGNQVAARVDLSPPCLRGRPVFMCCSLVSPGFPSLSVCPSSPGYFSPPLRPWDWDPSLAQHTYSPCNFSFPEFSPRSTSPYPITFLSFLTALVAQSFFVSS